MGGAMASIYPIAAGHLAAVRLSDPVGHPSLKLTQRLVVPNRARMASANGEQSDLVGDVRRRKRPRTEPRYCNVCGGEVPERNTGGACCTFTVAGKVVFKSCTCGSPTFRENDDSRVRPDHWPPIDDPYAYYDKKFVPHYKDLILPGKQRFECGELRGSTFVEVYSKYGFSDWLPLLPCSVGEERVSNAGWRSLARDRLAGEYAGTEIWRRFQHFCSAMISNEWHDFD